MPRRRTEPTAASLLGSWTDADTAMHIVGTSLGMFDNGLLDPDAVLSDETPLRHALFDVLLSLVEGGAVEMRPSEDGRYAFRLRADYATAAIEPDNEQTVDLEPPSPHLAELTRLRRELDDALGRADFAEALAAERERLLRLASVPVPATHVEARAETRVETPVERRASPVAGLDPEGQSVLDVLYAARTATGARTARAGDDDVIDLREADKPETSEVVYLPPPAPAPDGDDGDGAGAHRQKWSGYALDKPRPHLSTVDRLADDG